MLYINSNVWLLTLKAERIVKHLDPEDIQKTKGHCRLEAPETRVTLDGRNELTVKVITDFFMKQ